MPKQFMFSIWNVVKRVPYLDNSFEFAYMRLLILTLRQDKWPAAVKELLCVTKPGDFVQLLESDTEARA